MFSYPDGNDVETDVLPRKNSLARSLSKAPDEGVSTREGVSGQTKDGKIAKWSERSYSWRKRRSGLVVDKSLVGFSKKGHGGSARLEEGLDESSDNKDGKGGDDREGGNERKGDDERKGDKKNANVEGEDSENEALDLLSESLLSEGDWMRSKDDLIRPTNLCLTTHTTDSGCNNELNKMCVVKIERLDWSPKGLPLGDDVEQSLALSTSQESRRARRDSQSPLAGGSPLDQGRSLNKSNRFVGSMSDDYGEDVDKCGRGKYVGAGTSVKVSGDRKIVVHTEKKVLNNECVEPEGFEDSRHVIKEALADARVQDRDEDVEGDMDDVETAGASGHVSRNTSNVRDVRDCRVQLHDEDRGL